MDILTEYFTMIKARLTFEELVSYVWHDKTVQDEIIRLNTIGQLFDEGQRGDGTFLDDYTNASVVYYNKPAGRIKLYETGDFYRSFAILVNGLNAEIMADPIKTNEDGSSINLFKEFGDEIVGLTEESKVLLKEVMREPIIRFTKRRLSVY